MTWFKKPKRAQHEYLVEVSEPRREPKWENIDQLYKRFVKSEANAIFDTVQQGGTVVKGEVTFRPAYKVECYW